MKFIDFLKVVSSGTSAASLTLGAAEQGCRTLAQAITDGDVTVGDTDVVLVINDDAGNREMSLFTIASTTQITRTQVLRSTAGGTTAVTFNGSALTVYSDVPASWLKGQSITDYLANNPGGAALGTDIVLVMRGNTIVGVADSALAAYCATQWRSGTETVIDINSTDALVLDKIAHNRNRLMCSVTPSSITPAAWPSIGDGFSCAIDNVSGADITLEGMTVRPSGSVIPIGGWADIWAKGGSVFANVSGIASDGGGGGGGGVVAPGAVSSFTAGVADSSTQVLSWTAPTVGSAPFTYKIEFAPHGGSNWTTFAAAATGLTTTVTGLAASTSYDYRITPSNSAGAGVATSLANKSTAAAGGGGTANPPTATTSTGDSTFASALSTYGGSNFWQTILPPDGLTITDVDCAVSTSDTIVPDASITFTDGHTAGQGKWGGAMTINAQGLAYVSPSISFSLSIPQAINVYCWIIVHLSDGSTVNMVYKTPIPLGDSVTLAWRTTVESATVV